MKVLVCDDRPDECERTAASIRNLGLANVEVEPLCADELQKEIQSLFAGSGALLDEGAHPQLPAVETRFDHADLVLLDNDLSHMAGSGIRVTAEAIAGYVRAFSKAAYVVSLNKNPKVDFDLRFLVGDHATRADLALNARHLENRALWTGKAADADAGFRPWYWPTLLAEPARRREQHAFVKRELDSSIVAALELADEELEAMSRHALGFLAPEARLDDLAAIKQLTFKQFAVQSSRSIPDQVQRERLVSRVPEGSAACDAVSRIVAADLDLWFRRDILAPQDILVDLPHLVERLPFLLLNPSELGSWNKVLECTESPYGMKQAMHEKFVAASLYPHSAWTGRPCFRWTALDRNDDLGGLLSAPATNWAAAVFCEDMSLFVLRGESPKEFVAEFEGGWSRRFVKELSKLNYSPASRFAL